MNFTKIILSILILVSGFSACTVNKITRYKIANSKSILTGKIVDLDNGQILPGAVKGGDKTIIANADNNGIYRAELKPRTYKIRAAFIGYKFSKPKTIKIEPGDSIVLNFKLKYANLGTVN